jgi:hypothetical protein
MTWSLRPLATEKSKSRKRPYKLIAIPMIDDATLESMEAVVDYLLEIEHKHWQECGRPKRHIYRDLKRIAKAVDLLRSLYLTHN